MHKAPGSSSFWVTLGLAAVLGLAFALHPFATATNAILEQGVRTSTVDHLVMLPIGVLAIVFGRTFIGLETFGVMAPLILGFAFERVGTLTGLLAFVLLLAIVTPIRWLLERFPMLTVARTGVLVTLCALLLLLATALAGATVPALRGVEFGLPVVAMSGMIDRFVTAQMDQSPKEAIKLSLYTLVTATLVSMLVGIGALRTLILREPDLLVLCLPAILALGRYRGLRLVERFRFRVVPADAAP